MPLNSLEEQQKLRHIFFGFLIFVVTAACYTIIGVEMYFKQNEDAFKNMDRYLALVYAFFFFCCALGFVTAGSVMLYRLNKHYEEIYKAKRGLILAVTIIQATSISLLASRNVIYYSFWQDYWEKVEDSLNENDYRLPLTHFLSIFFTELVPIGFQTVSMLIAVRANMK